MTIRNRLFGVCAATMMIAASANGVVVTRVCLLRGAEEVPPTTSTAIGCGKFVIDTDANTVTYRIVVGGLTTAETAAHIHGFSAPGVNSGVLHTLPSGHIKTGTWNYAESQEAAILDGMCYVNVHTTMFPGGEVRGQIVTHVASLDGGQEVPSNATTGSGWGVFMMDRAANTLRYHIVVSGLSAAESAAHIHGYSNYGTNSGIQHGLALGALKTGTWSYPAAQEQAIVDGLTYVNIHTTAIPGGEIRGQIVSSVNPIDGLQEVPPTPSSTIGYALIAIDRNADVLGYDIRRTGLATAETAAHIHGYSGVGVNSGVLHTLPAGALKRGTWAFGAANEANIDAQRTYVNIHSTAFGGGEIRGQIMLAMLPEPVICHGQCIADYDDGSGTGTPDGGVTIEDLLYYLDIFDAGNACADVDGGTGTGTQDGGVTIEDLLYYLLRFDLGC